MKRKKILILNQGNTFNLGDKAILEVLNTYFSKEYDVDFMPFWDEKEVYGLLWNINILRKLLIFSMKIPFIIDCFNYLHIHRTVKNTYCAVIIGGGELLGAHNGFNSSFYCWTNFFSKKNIDIYVVGVSGDMDMREYSLNRYASSLRRCKVIYVRDTYTQNLYKNNYKLSPSLYPDVVFSLKKLREDYLNLEKENIIIVSPTSFTREIINGLNLTSENDYIDYLCDLIKKVPFLENKILLLSTTKEDYKIINLLYTHLKKNTNNINVEIVNICTLNEFIEIVKKSKYIVSGRMHAMIIGLLYQNTILPIPFKKKLIVFNDEYNNKQIDIHSIEDNSIESLNKINLYIKQNH